LSKADGKKEEDLSKFLACGVGQRARCQELVLAAHVEMLDQERRDFGPGYYVQTDLEADREVANTLADLILSGMLATDDVIDEAAEDGEQSA
jgi:hypothetical protein